MDAAQEEAAAAPVRQRVIAFVKGGEQVLADAFGSADPLPPNDPTAGEPLFDTQPPMGKLLFRSP
eukprot:2414967-Prorocentrum_lima.AAC.1